MNESFMKATSAADRWIGNADKLWEERYIKREEKKTETIWQP